MKRDSDRSFREQRLSSLRSFDNTGKDLEANNAHEFAYPTIRDWRSHFAIDFSIHAGHFTLEEYVTSENPSLSS